MRRTKIVATIGPKTCQYEQILRLAKEGMNVARLNMSYGDHAWHKKIIRCIRTINEKGLYSVAILLDTKGSEIRSGDLKKDILLNKGDTFIFTIRHQPEYEANCTEVSYDGFIADVNVGDTILVDGGMLSFLVQEKTATEVHCVALNQGALSSRRHLNIKGKSSHAPTITKKDRADIAFGIEEGVDFIALSFVKEPKAIIELKTLLAQKKANIDVVAKIESAAALAHLSNIIEVADGVMVARGDLGAEVSLEEIPLLQEEIVRLAYEHRRPVIVATHLLESMIVNPTPTRAEVTDIATAVRQRTDAIMLSGETAAGRYPFEAIKLMDVVATRIEKRLMEDVAVLPASADRKEEIGRNAANLSNTLKAAAILVFTRRGYMATVLSHFRPNCAIYAFTNMTTVRRRLNLYWGVTAFRIEFSDDPEKTIQRAVRLLTEKKLLSSGHEVVVVSDILVGKEYVETIQLRRI